MLHSMQKFAHHTVVDLLPVDAQGQDAQAVLVVAGVWVAFVTVSWKKKEGHEGLWDYLPEPS